MNGPKRIADDSSSFIVWVVLNPCREMVEMKNTVYVQGKNGIYSFGH